MDNNREDTVPDQGLRSPRSRRSGGTVPAPRSSSSNDGPSSACTAGVEEEHASAKAKMSGREGEVNIPPAGGSGHREEVRTPSVSLTRLRDTKNAEEFYSPCSASLISGGITSSPRDMIEPVAIPGTSRRDQDELNMSDASTYASTMSMDTSADGTILIDSEGELIPRTSKKRKRGRPSKENSGIPPKGQKESAIPRGEQKAQERIEDFLEELKNAPTQDLGAVIIEEMAQVWRVSKVSRGLKGELSGALKRASCRTRAAVQALLTKEKGERTAITGASIPPAEGKGSKEEEIALLRRQLAEANRRLEELEGRNRRRGIEEEVRPQWQRMETEGEDSPSPSSPKCQPRAKRVKKDPSKGRRVQRRIMSSSGEEESEGGRAKNAPPPRSSSRPREEILPPMNEWPPALRPAIQGVRKNLDSPPPRISPPAPGAARGEGWEGMESRIMARLTQMFEQWAGIRTGTTSKEGKERRQGPAPPTKGQGKGQGQGAGRNPLGGNPKANNSKGEAQVASKEAKKAGTQKAGQKRSPTRASVGPAGPQNAHTGEEPTPWAKVVGRKARHKRGGNTAGVSNEDPKGDPQRTQQARGRMNEGRNQRTNPLPKQDGARKTQGARKKRKRPPRSAAVVVTCPEGQYGEVMRTAREHISLADLGIEATRPKRALTGALILEIPGNDGDARADRLADQMRRVLAGKEGVRISRPRKMGELRIRGLEDSTTKREVLEAVTETCGCRADEVQMGDIVRSTGGLYSVWIKCPLEGANKLARTGHVRVGWTKAKVEALEERPLQCFKCLRRGHVRAQCPYEEDRTGVCYRCGLEGHNAKGCANPPQCALCKTAGRRANHRLGGKACNAPPPKKKAVGRGTTQRTGDKPVGQYNGPPAPPPCALGGPKQPPQWDYVIPPLPCASGGSGEEPKERRPPGPRVVAMEVVAPPRKVNKERKGGLEEPMDLEATNGH